MGGGEALGANGQRRRGETVLGGLKKGWAGSGFGAEVKNKNNGERAMFWGEKEKGRGGDEALRRTERGHGGKRLRGGRKK
jgi:hypothetical protein